MRRSLPLVLVTVSLSACSITIGFGERGSGEVITETREVSGFSEIVLEGNGRVIVEVTGTESLTIEAEDNLMPLLTSSVEDGTLVLGATESIAPTRDIVYTITASTLEGLDIDGSGHIEAADLSGEAFTADIDGSGTIVLPELSLDRLDATISGSGDIEVSGTASLLEVSVSGSGNFEAEGLEASDATVVVSGSGEAVVNVTDSLDATVSGSGSIEYLGDPEVTSTISGSGDIEQR
ncbi:MAG TPA: head GIN domain-containing protein [Acidimicrobiia bacterium]|nr:head GIN domain-containing protein [Acidimicrobiia bacterium]